MKYFSGAACLLLGCSGFGAAPPLEAQVTVRAQTTEGQPLAGVVLEAGGRKAVSDGDGAVQLLLSGTEGERREIAVTCPDDYEAPSSTLTVSIRRSVDAARAYNYDVACAPLRHSVVVAVRAVHGPDLPILHHGAEVGRTNQAGVAHALVTLPAGESLRITLDTDGRDLLPVSPSFDFPAATGDDILAIHQVFEVPVKPRAPRRLVKKAENRPTRL